MPEESIITVQRSVLIGVGTVQEQEINKICRKIANISNEIKIINKKNLVCPRRLVNF